MQRRLFLGSMLGAAAAGLPLARALAAANAPVAGDVPATRLGGGETVLSRSAVQDFRASLRGPLLMAGQDGYDRARQVWNGMIDRRPALIARCTGATDVARSVQFARANDLLVAVRSGGHSTSGQSVCDGGLMIDLADMRGVRVDPRARRARVPGGCLLGELDREAQFFGLATTAGTVSHTGAAGLTLGGGFGRLGRRFGLTCDNLVSVDVVTAGGDVVRASNDENRELFWGLRGGGGNFGIATSFEYRLHEVSPTILGGPIIFPFARAREVLDFFVEFTARAPDELNLDCAIVAPPGGKPMVILEVCYSGDLARGEKVIAPVRSFTKPLADQVKAMPYLQLQSGGDEANAAGRNYYVKSGFVEAPDPKLFDAMLAGFSPAAGRSTVMLLQQLGGAIGRVRPDATAFNHRQARFDLLVLGGWEDPAQTPEHTAWIRDFWRGLEGYTRGYYFNTTIGDSQEKVRANFGANYPRLVKLKDRYDPGNLFRLNANVQPT
ncbi:MAG: FAD-binding oxidoreductase [Chromatiales bacterium]|nr:FAD-binding oxidoreductase [Chromatiales bacterium]